MTSKGQYCQTITHFNLLCINLKDLLAFTLCVFVLCLYVCIYATCTPTALGGQKTSRTGVQMVMWVLGTKPGSFARAASTLPLSHVSSLVPHFLKAQVKVVIIKEELFSQYQLHCTKHLTMI